VDAGFGKAVTPDVAIPNRNQDKKQQKEVWRNIKTKNEIFIEMAGRLICCIQID
jgi:hypothetical protein